MRSAASVPGQHSTMITFGCQRAMSRPFRASSSVPSMSMLTKSSRGNPDMNSSWFSVSTGTRTTVSGPDRGLVGRSEECAVGLLALTENSPHSCACPSTAARMLRRRDCLSREA